MALVAMLLLGWFVLSLPLGIVVGRLLGGARPASAPERDVNVARPTVTPARTRVAV